MLHLAGVSRLAAAFACLWALALAAPDRGIVTFGDSLTDTGNFFNKISNRTTPLPNVYYKGRFTNAPGTWADQLSYNKRLQVENFAFGGATACAFPAPLNVAPSFLQQIALFQQRLKTDSKFRQRLRGKTVIPTIWIGHNDIGAAGALLSPSQQLQIPANTIQCILNGTAALLKAGYKTVVLGTLAPVSLTPLIQDLGTNITFQVSLGEGIINTGVRRGVAALAKQYPRSRVVLWEANMFFRDIALNPGKYGFKVGNTNTCVQPNSPTYSSIRGTIPTSICPRPSDYLFYDILHPTSRGHSFIRNTLLDTLVRAKLIKSRRS